jgi:hypothetical protein
LARGQLWGSRKFQDSSSYLAKIRPQEKYKMTMTASKLYNKATHFDMDTTSDIRK